MKKKKKWTERKQTPSKFNIIVVIAIVLVAVCFILTASGHQSAYIQNYARHFKQNIAMIAAKMNIKAPEDWLHPPEETPPENPADVPQAAEASPEASPAVTAKTQEVSSASSTLMPKSEVHSEAKVLAMMNAASSEYLRYDNMLICADKTSLTAYNAQAEMQWSLPAQISNPILDTSGKYIALADKGGRKLMLFKGKKQVYSVQTTENIIRMSVSSGGDVALVTEKAAYKGAVSVYNKKGSEVFLWNSGTDSILDADISPRKRRLAISQLSASSGNIKSTISFFNINKTESDTSLSYDNCVMFDVEFTGETLSAIGDNQMAGISAGGKQQWLLDYGGRTLTHYQMEETGAKLCAFDNHNVSELTFVSANGKTDKAQQAEIIPDYVDIYSGYCSYNSGRNAVFGKISGVNMKKYPCTKDIRRLIILDDKTIAAVYSTSIEFINMQE